MYVTEIVADNVQFLSSSGERREEGYKSSRESFNRDNNNRVNDPFANDARFPDIDDDDLPF